MHGPGKVFIVVLVVRWVMCQPISRAGKNLVLFAHIGPLVRLQRHVPSLLPLLVYHSTYAHTSPSLIAHFSCSWSHRAGILYFYHVLHSLWLLRAGLLEVRPDLLKTALRFLKISHFNIASTIKITGHYTLWDAPSHQFCELKQKEPKLQRILLTFF